MDHLCYLCLVFVMLSRLFATSWIVFVMFNCVFVTFPCGILGPGVVLDCIDSCFLPPFLLFGFAQFFKFVSF